MDTINPNDPRPIYEQVDGMLRVWVRDGTFGFGQRMPDERTLAQQLGVSRTTVRRAISGLAKQGVLVRMRGRGTFVAAALPRTPDAPRATTIAVVVPPGQFGAGQSLFYHRILNGLHEAMEPQGHALLMRRATSPCADLVESLNANEQVGGVVVLGIVDPEMHAALKQLSVPLVLVDSGPLPQKLWDCVTHDAEDGADHAVTHLLQLGHRAIGLMNFVPETNSSRQRRMGYEKALERFGAVLRPELMFSTSLTVTSAHATMRHALRQGCEPTAVFCTSDELAIGVMAAARDHGLSIPRDFSVVGFGDLGHMTVPPLSSVRIPLEQMGRRAIELLEQRMRKSDLPPRTICMPVELVSRGSSDCPCVSASAVAAG